MKPKKPSAAHTRLVKSKPVDLSIAYAYGLAKENSMFPAVARFNVTKDKNGNVEPDDDDIIDGFDGFSDFSFAFDTVTLGKPAHFTFPTDAADDVIRAIRKTWPKTWKQIVVIRVTVG